MRKTSMVLILVNVLLGAAWTVSWRSQGESEDWFYDCCRGAGPEAYCCFNCCMWTSNCNADIDCRAP